MDSKSPHFRFPRHTSDSLTSFNAPESKGNSTFVDILVIDKWFGDLTLYEGKLSQINDSQVDDAFKDELLAIQEWFDVLSDTEKTTALLTLVSNLNLDQTKFLLSVLQKMANKESVGLGVSSDREKPNNFRSSPKLEKKLLNLSIATTLGMAGPRSADPSMAVNDQDSYFPGMNVISPMMPSAPLRPSRRLYDRFSFPGNEETEKTSVMDTVRNSMDPSNPMPTIHSYTNSPISGIPSLTQRPSTPADEAISSADWSVHASSYNSNFPMTTSAPAGPNVSVSKSHHPPNLTKSQQSFESTPPLLMGDLAFRPLSLVSPHVQKYSGSAKPTPTRARQSSSPTSDDDRLSNRSSSKRSGSVGESSKRSGSTGTSHKEKGKIPDQVDLAALSGNITTLILDIPSWLRSLRLHKYTPIFEHMIWQDMINLTDEDLIDRGVAALGARRKMLKVFALVKQELEQHSMY
jgi:hypothetical protein